MAGTETKKKIDEIESNTSNNVKVSPTNDFIINSPNVIANKVLFVDSSKEIRTNAIDQSNITKNSLEEIVDPDNTNGSGEDYAIGSLWFNKSNKKLWIAEDVSFTAPIAATFAGQVAGMTTDILITADNTGTGGNSISLPFDGIDDIDQAISDWNGSNPGNTATLTSGDGSQVPDNLETIDLAGGAAVVEAAIWNRSREVIIDTAANIAALPREAGNLYFESDTLLYKGDDGSALIDLGSGGGGGGVDTYINEKFEATESADFTTGNSPTLSGGSIDGTLADETASPIEGLQSIRYTMGATSTDDFFLMPSKALEDWQPGKDNTLILFAKYDGDDNDIKIVIKDSAGNDIAPSDALIKSSSIVKRYEIKFFMPSAATTIEIGFLVLVGNDTQILTFDLVEANTNPFVIGSLTDTQSVIFNTHAGYGSTNTMIPHFTNEVQNSGANIVTIVNDTTDGFSITANKKCRVYASYSAAATTVHRIGFSLNSSELTTAISGITAADRLAIEASTNANEEASMTVPVDMEAGDVLRPHTDGATGAVTSRHHITIVAVAESEALISVDSGTENNFSARCDGSAGAGVSVVSENFPFIASVVRNSLGNFTITFITNFFSVAPSIIALVETGTGTIGMNPIIDSVTASGFDILTGNAGVALVDLDFTILVSRQGLDYKNPNAAAISPLLQIAYLKQVETSGTSGGTSTAGSFQTRVLNSLTGNTNFITLSSNQFTLNKGEYWIEFSSTQYSTVLLGKGLIHNITDASDESDLIGEGVRTEAGNTKASTGRGPLTLASTKTFELRHRTSATLATFGFGLATGFGVSEIYSSVTITKLR